MKYLILLLSLSTAYAAELPFDSNARSYNFYSPHSGYQGTWQKGLGNTWQLYTPHGGYQGTMQRDLRGDWQIYTPHGGYRGTWQRTD